MNVSRIRVVDVQPHEGGYGNTNGVIIAIDYFITNGVVAAIIAQVGYTSPQSQSERLLIM